MNREAIKAMLDSVALGDQVQLDGMDAPMEARYITERWIFLSDCPADEEQTAVMLRHYRVVDKQALVHGVDEWLLNTLLPMYPDLYAFRNAEANAVYAKTLDDGISTIGPKSLVPITGVKIRSGGSGDE